MIENKLQVQVHIWDTAGQERFKSLTKHHYKGAHIALLVFDINEPGSLNRTEHWLSELKEHTPENCQTILIANKCDLESKCNPIQFAKKYNLQFCMTSSHYERDA